MKKIFLLMSVFATPASAQVQFCPGSEIPYTFTIFQDVLLINRAYHRAFCQKTEGDKYECLEKWPGDETPSVYVVHAKRLENGKLSIRPPLENDEPMIVPECE
ncbi:MAG: hypothetical protein K5905_28535 [Roseibium sp.]|uniref:hypothetical protein n=1 Tax=Roseibium sp. TaxID=1936156 RepID=UPI002625449D|nr:hypothetical protein [Roseibium sp.]MCV0429413.1 hypothetical protein [Roseibium sp.]